MKKAFFKFSFISFMIPLSCFAHLDWEYVFHQDQQGWQVGFSDYPIDGETFFELAHGWENLPTVIEDEDWGLLTKGFFLSGNNHSDDLFMFVKRRIGGFEPNTLYALYCSVLIETNVPSDMPGIGGSPGKSVFFKFGAAPAEPQNIESQGSYILNVDKGNQSQGGLHAMVIGDLEHPSADGQTYLPKQLKNEIPLMVSSDAEGYLWFFMGTDSGFEGLTRFYLAKITLHAEKSLD
jgi:hypothetical protein